TGIDGESVRVGEPLETRSLARGERPRPRRMGETTSPRGHEAARDRWRGLILPQTSIYGPVRGGRSVTIRSDVKREVVLIVPEQPLHTRTIGGTQLAGLIEDRIPFRILEIPDHPP